MDNSPDPWHKMKVNEEMERLEAVLNLNKSGSATGTTATFGDGETVTRPTKRKLAGR